MRTALAEEPLAGVLSLPRVLPDIPVDSLCLAVVSGTEWLTGRTETGDWTTPSAIGFYFAKLWYHKRLYPQIFTVAALAHVRRLTLTQQ